MKKLIAARDLRPGMFLEADVVKDYKNGEEQSFLEAREAVSTGDKSKRARLTGRMNARVERDGGILITSVSQVESLQQTGLSMITINSEKGDDLPGSVKPLTDPSRTPPPEGRLVHFDEEIERAKEARDETTETLRETLQNVALGKGVDVEKIHGASTIITESILRNMDAMVSLTRIKQHDAYTAVHCMNVCTLVVAMAQADNVSPSILPMITTAALLHDVGKTRVPLEILNKPGRFEPHELEEMRKHVIYSAEVLEEAGGFPEEAIAIAMQHHEMMDGSGYPHKLRGEQIHPFARMIAVADVYDALTAKRIYKPAMPMYQSLLRIHKNKGTEFDDHAVNLFVKALGAYPVGSYVELNTREKAVVFEPNPVDSRKPTVGILNTSSQKDRAVPLVVDLGLRSEAEGREIAKVLDPHRLNVDVEKALQRIERKGERRDRRRR